MLLNFQERSTKDGCISFTAQKKKNASSVVMSDRAANCVLGDKDGRKRREKKKLPPGYGLCSESVAGLDFGRKKREKKKKLVKKERKV